MTGRGGTGDSLEKSERYPNLFLAGAPRCGTTFLFDLLSRSEEIFVPRDKEPSYFFYRGNSRVVHRGKAIPNRRESFEEQAYLGLYARWRDERWALDGSTYYLLDRACAEGISLRSPQAKVILLLRDPIARAHSHYLMEKNDGWVSEAFGQAIEVELAEMRSPGVPYAGHYHFIRGSCYLPGLQSFVSRFGADNVRVILFDDLVANSQGCLDGICAFLQIEPIAVAQAPSRKNESGIVRNAMGAWLTSRYRYSRMRDVLSPVTPRVIRDAIRELLMKAHRSNRPAEGIDDAALAVLKKHLDGEMDRAVSFCESSGILVSP